MGGRLVAGALGAGLVCGVFAASMAQADDQPGGVAPAHYVENGYAGQGRGYGPPGHNYRPPPWGWKRPFPEDRPYWNSRPYDEDRRRTQNRYRYMRTWAHRSSQKHPPYP